MPGGHRLDGAFGAFEAPAPGSGALLSCSLRSTRALWAGLAGRGVSCFGPNVWRGRSGCANAACLRSEPAWSLEPGAWSPTRYTPLMAFAPEYVHYVLNDNFEDAKALFLSPLMAIHYAHLVMLADTGIVSRADAHRIREALDAVALDEVRGRPVRRLVRRPVLLRRRAARGVVRRGRRGPAAHRAQPQRHRHDHVPDAPA